MTSADHDCGLSLEARQPAAGLRVRTGTSQGQRGMVGWAVHADHVVNAAQAEAASRTIATALDGESQPAPFHVLVRHVQREMLRGPAGRGPDRMSLQATGQA
jgi:hypothetical protein